MCAFDLIYMLVSCSPPIVCHPRIVMCDEYLVLSSELCVMKSLCAQTGTWSFPGCRASTGWDLWPLWPFELTGGALLSCYPFLCTCPLGTITLRAIPETDEGGFCVSHKRCVPKNGSLDPSNHNPTKRIPKTDLGEAGWRTPKPDLHTMGILCSIDIQNDLLQPLRNENCNINLREIF